MATEWKPVLVFLRNDEKKVMVVSMLPEEESRDLMLEAVAAPRITGEEEAEWTEKIGLAPTSSHQKVH